jgi:hypothetical protein
MKKIALLVPMLLVCACSKPQETQVPYEVVAAYGHGLPGDPDDSVIIANAPTLLPRIINGCGVALSDIRVEFATEGMMDARFELSPGQEKNVLACVREHLPKGASIRQAHP